MKVVFRALKITAFVILAFAVVFVLVGKINIRNAEKRAVLNQYDAAECSNVCNSLQNGGSFIDEWGHCRCYHQASDYKTP